MYIIPFLWVSFMFQKKPTMQIGQISCHFRDKKKFEVRAN